MKILKRNGRGLGSSSLLLLLVLLFFSCQSLPVRVPTEGYAGLLPRDAKLKASLALEESGGLFAALLSLTETAVPEQFLQYTSRIYLALDDLPEPGAPGMAPALIALGDFPRTALDIALWWDKAWESGESAETPFALWINRESGLCLANPDGKVLFAAYNRPVLEQMLEDYHAGGNPSEEPGNPSEEPGNRMMEESAAVVAFPALDGDLRRTLMPSLDRVPVESLVIGLERYESGYRGTMVFRMDSERNASILATLLRFALLAAKDQEGERLFPEPQFIELTTAERYVTAAGLPLPEEYLLSVAAGFFAGNKEE